MARPLPAMIGKLLWGTRLEDAIERGRKNNFDLLRLVAALSVLFGHSFVLASGSPDDVGSDPISPLLVPLTGFGEKTHELAIDVFFVISGFLIARSFLTQRTTISFVEARILRLFPATILCSILTVSLLAILSSHSAGEYFGESQTWRYLFKNAFLWRIEFHLPGVFTENSFTGAVNGSLWTLPVELRCYIYLLIVGMLGVFRLRLTANIFTIVLVTLFLVPEWSSIVTRDINKWRLFLFFFIGAAFYSNRKYIHLGIAPLIGLILIYNLVAPFERFRAVVFVVLVTYIVLSLALAQYVKVIDPGRFADLSYGVYLYAFPVQQAVVHFGGGEITGWFVTLWATIVTLLFAALSWFLLEKPALAAKGRFSGRLEVRLAQRFPRLDRLTRRFLILDWIKSRLQSHGLLK